jgi:rhodanese-related sulfurtransferase
MESNVPQLAPHTVDELRAGGGVALLDVREASEWQAGRIAGAQWIPLGELGARLGEVPSERLVVVCRSGVRSDLAAEALRERGYDASNLAGGMHAWVGAGLPIDPDGGYVA